MTIDVEYWLNPSLHHTHKPEDPSLIAQDLHALAIELRAAWLGDALGLDAEDHHEVTGAIESDANLSTALAPRNLDDQRYGIVFTAALRERLRIALELPRIYTWLCPCCQRAHGDMDRLCRRCGCERHVDAGQHHPDRHRPSRRHPNITERAWCSRTIARTQ